MKARLTPLVLAIAVATAWAMATYPFAWWTNEYEAYGRYVVAPGLLVVVGIGVAGAVWPAWWAPRRAAVIALIALLAVAGHLRGKDMQRRQLQERASERLSEHLETHPELLAPPPSEAPAEPVE